MPTTDAAIARVEEQKAAGYDFLKIHPGVRRDVFEALASTAQQSGIRFAGHVPLDLGLARALELRFATIDHIDGYVEALVRADPPLKATDSQWFGVNLARYADKSRIPALVEAARQAGTWIVPTQTLFEHGQGDDDPTAMAKWPEMRYVPPQQLEQWIAGKQKFPASPDGAAENRRQFLEVRRALLMALHGGGAGIVLGPDAPQSNFSISRSLEDLNISQDKSRFGLNRERPSVFHENVETSVCESILLLQRLIRIAYAAYPYPPHLFFFTSRAKSSGAFIFISTNSPHFSL